MVLNYHQEYMAEMNKQLSYTKLEIGKRVESTGWNAVILASFNLCFGNSLQVNSLHG
jgi:hypothetical protein